MLTNEKYKGDMMLQKTFMEDYLKEKYRIAYQILCERKSPGHYFSGDI